MSRDRTRWLLMAFVSLALSPPAGRAQTCLQVTLASSDAGESGLSQPCLEPSGTYLDTRSSNDVRQCVMETLDAQGAGVLRHYWVFPNVPPGPRYLTWEAYRPTGGNDSFTFLWNTTGPGTSWNSLNVCVGNAAEISGGGGLVASLPPGSQTATIYIQARDTLGFGNGPDRLLDVLYVDHLRICTRPTYAAENTDSLCSDQFDNDLDGFVDCGSPSCAGHAGCVATETLCHDGLDNDGDGDIDCDGPGASDPDADCLCRPGECPPPSNCP